MVSQERLFAVSPEQKGEQTLEKLSRLRLAVRNRLIACIVLFSVTGLLLWAKTDSFSVFENSIIAGILLTWLAIRRPLERFRAAYKYTFVMRALESQFTDVVYKSRTGISRKTIADTQMMDLGTSFHSEDYIRARYGDILFEQSDVLIQQSAGKSTVTIFQGRWMIFDFNKHFRTNFQIVQKGFPNAKHRRFFGTENSLFKKISMESEAFNEEFRVYAQNEHDAFYVITPAFMERLQNLAARNKGKLLFCFVRNRLHIAIHDGKDSFEPGSVFEPIDAQKAIRMACSEMGVVTRFINELSLDNDLFLPTE
jgi:hypothetical protein